MNFNMAAEPLTRAMMLRARMEAAVVAALLVALLTTWWMQPTMVEHYAKVDLYQCLRWSIPMEKLNGIGFRGSNSNAAGAWCLAGNGTAGLDVLATGTSIFEGMQSRVQVHGSEQQAGRYDESAINAEAINAEAINAEAINAEAISAEAISAETDAISAGVLELRHGVEGPVMEQGMLSHSWCTPKESNGSAQNSSVNALTGLQPACFSNQCSDNGLAVQYNPFYVVDFNATMENGYELNGDFGDYSVWHRNKHYMEFCSGFLDKLVELTFDFIENFDINDVDTAIKKIFYGGMGQFFGLMSVERMWMSWLTAIFSMLALSHLGLWFKTSTRPRTFTSRNPTRMERHRLRVKKVELQMQLKAVLFASWISCCSGMEGGSPGENAFLQQMSMLATAATNAATAAERALGMMANQPVSSSHATGDGGLQAATRILKNPDVYTGDDPLGFSGWKFTFCSWLSFGDPRFQKAFDNLDKLSPTDDIPEYSEVERELSVKLFAILASYLKGRCLSLVKSMAKSKDGFRLWRALVQEYEPSSRQRSLALAQTLSNYPAFTNAKSIMEQILSYEQLVQQFEEASSSTYPAELKIATLVKCSGQKLREYLQLTINEHTTYPQLKETMMGYDKACRAWTPESVLKSLQGSTSSDQGPQPMEVDRIENKGKGKHKGKGKDKGKSWWNYGGFGSGAFGRGRGKGRGHNNKGKGKGKSKSKSKSKGKDFGKKGKNKGKVDSQQCKLCYEYGHWSRECPNRMVQQVVQGDPAQLPQVPVQPAGQGVQQQQVRHSPQSSYPSSTSASTVRRIFTIPMGVPTLTSSSGSSVRMVSSGDEFDKGVVILDSGSDVSLLPLSYGQCGADAVQPEDVQLRDCQGSHLKVTGYRTVSLVVEDGDGTEAELEHAFLIANVKSCILSLGQLYRNGWCVKQMEDGAGPYLESPDRELRVPVFYQRNSLAISATVCRVEQVEDESLLSPHAYVRAIVELEDRFRPEEPKNNSWQVSDGNPFMRCVGTHFIDPRPTWAGNFGFRTTLVQKRSTADEDHGWYVVEVSAKYLELDDPFGPIPGLDSIAQGEDVIVLTILSERDEPLVRFGGLLDAGGYMLEEPYTPESPYRGEDADVLPIEGLEINPVLDEGRDDIMGRDIPEHQAIAPAVRADAESEAIVVNDVQVTPYSSVETLRAAGRFLGVSTAGSKRKIFERIRESHVSSLRLRALEVARGEYEAMQPHPQYQDAPAQPTARERKLHEVTHLPFKKWCSVCVQTKSKANQQKPTPPDEMAQRTFPTLQCDFYTVSGNLNVLIMVDSWTKFVAVEPLRNKLQSVVGGAVARFLGELGYYDQVELAFDNEPVLAAGMRVALGNSMQKGAQHLQKGAFKQFEPKANA